jgi:RimJ/RimL family protein N-acetyltransferase
LTRLYLSPDIDPITAKSARNNPRVWRYCRQYSLISDDQQSAWLDKIETDPTIKMFSLRTDDDGPEYGLTLTDQQVGVCGFTSIDRHNRSAEFSLYINPENQGNGFGKQGLTLLLDHGFKDWGFHRIWGEVFENNPAMSIFKEVGFEVVGKLRHSYFRDGKWINSYIIDLLSTDWKARPNEI